MNRDIELSGKLQEDYGITKDEAGSQIRRFEQCNENYRPKTSS